MSKLEDYTDGELENSVKHYEILLVSIANFRTYAYDEVKPVDFQYIKHITKAIKPIISELKARGINYKIKTLNNE